MQTCGRTNQDLPIHSIINTTIKDVIPWMAQREHRYSSVGYVWRRLHWRPSLHQSLLACYAIDAATAGPK